MMEPTVALVTCEQALRQLMTTVFGSAYGDAWLAKVAKPDDIEAWKRRRDVESAKREARGVAQVAQNLLSYAELYQLLEIAERQWEHLQPALGKKRETGALLKRFDDLRNTVAHSRELLPFEEELLSGIAGEIRNRVTQHMSSQDPTGDFYPRIENVTDSLGNTLERYPVDTPRLVMLTQSTLQPGEVVTFKCVGIDPQNRELFWWIEVDNLIQAQAQGNEVVLSWEVADHHVRHSKNILIYMQAKESKYHRWGRYDQILQCSYRVIPPQA